VSLELAADTSASACGAEQAAVSVSRPNLPAWPWRTSVDGFGTYI